jgi:hypothetical protein
VTVNSSLAPLTADLPPGLTSVSAKRLVRMLAPVVEDPTGWASWEGTTGPRLARMADPQVGKTYKEADKAVQSLIRCLHAAHLQRMLIQPVDLAAEDTDEVAISVTDRLIAACLSEEGYAHLETSVCKSYRQGWESGLSDFEDMSTASSNARGLMARGLLPPAQSVTSSRLLGALKKSFEVKREQTAWPLATAETLVEVAKVADAVRDPQLADLTARQCGLNKAIAGWVARLVGSRSRSGLAQWLVGPGWAAFRFPDPPASVSDGRRAMMFVVDAPVVTATAENRAWDGCRPQPHGWQQMKTKTGHVLWRLVEYEDFEVESACMRPARDENVACITSEAFTPAEKKAEGSATGPFTGLPANLIRLMASVEKRLMQHVSDTSCYAFRGAQRVSQIVALFEKTYNEYAHHPMVGLVLGWALVVGGTTECMHEETHCMMSVVKLSGTTKESNSTHNKRSTYADVLEHISFAVQTMNDDADPFS